MTNEEILKKAIGIAIKNGYDVVMRDALSSVIAENKTSPTFEEELNGFSRVIIFSHEFAKAFWGNDKIMCIDCGEERKDGGRYCNDCATRMKKSWAVHLQQMILEENPIKYLENFI